MKLCLSSSLSCCLWCIVLCTHPCADDTPHLCSCGIVFPSFRGSPPTQGAIFNCIQLRNKWSVFSRFLLSRFAYFSCKKPAPLYAKWIRAYRKHQNFTDFYGGTANLDNWSSTKLFWLAFYQNSVKYCLFFGKRASSCHFAFVCSNDSDLKWFVRRSPLVSAFKAPVLVSCCLWSFWSLFLFS